MRIFLILIFASQLLFAQKSYDVCVYGGTSAGVIAAYSANKMGMKVLLIEPSKHLGGLTSGGLGQTDIGNKYAITGLSRAFYRRVGSHYGKLEQWIFEPHVTENIFLDFIKNSTVEVVFENHIVSVKKQKTSIQFIQLKSKKGLSKIKAKTFIDCSYEGDLMAMAGVGFHVGREANQVYHETWNGVQLLDKHQFPDDIDPYVQAGNPASGLLWGISSEKLAETGSGDAKLQAYNFRLCLSDSAANQIPITKPDGYDASHFELLLRYIEKKQPAELNWALMHLQSMPHHKTDINNSGPFSTDMIGENYDYANASFEERKSIIKKHENYIKSFLYFLGNDERVPKHLRDEMKRYGYPKDEYVDNQGFSPQAYIREARRMIGGLVMTQLHCEGNETVNDGIGLAAYTMDSHNAQRIVIEKNGKMMVKNEGDVQQGIGGLPPYPISYRAITPKEKECSNLLVPVCLSASHIAYGSIRMEPVFMVLGQSAGMAAAMAVQQKSSVQQIEVKKLQNMLEENPLLDGSIPEILIDNDSKNVSTNGNWNTVQKGYGKYGKNYFNSVDNQSISVEYKAAIKQTAKYKIYVYIPKFGGISPEMTVYIDQKKYVIKTTAEESDWKLIDALPLEKNQQTNIKITTENATGTIIADAVLLIAE
jgi:FAD dependent oxidoreductase